jgi:hypothetical protein
MQQLAALYYNATIKHLGEYSMQKTVHKWVRTNTKAAKALLYRQMQLQDID